MGGLIDDDAPALAGPGRAPPAARIVGVRAEDPRGEPDHAAELTELAGLDHGPDLRRHRTCPLVEDHAEAKARVLVRGEHATAVRHVDGEGLVGQDVKPLLEGIDRHDGMAPVGRRDHDRVHATRGDHAPVVRELRLRQVLDLVERPGAERRELQSVDGPYRVGVLAPHVAHADDPDSHRPQLDAPFTRGSHGAAPYHSTRGARRAASVSHSPGAVWSCGRRAVAVPRRTLLTFPRPPAKIRAACPACFCPASPHVEEEASRE